MRSVDARGFIYPLEPERRRRQWQLDAAMSRLGELRRRMGELESAREKLEDECVSQAAQVGRVWAERADPAAHARLLRYVATLQQSRVNAQGDIAACSELLQRARVECSQQQQQMDVLDKHRRDALNDYSIECHRRNAAEADQDWAARGSHYLLVTEAA